jgi:hypothetical protein
MGEKSSATAAAAEREPVGSSFKGRPSHPIKVKASGRMGNWHRGIGSVGSSSVF